MKFVSHSSPRVLLAAMTILLSVVLFASSAAASQTLFPDRVEVQRLFRQGDFAALESLIAGAEKAYGSGEVSDLIVEHSYYAFGSANPDFDAGFDAWIAAYPESHRPHLARGVYHRYLGWIYRGGAYTRNTTEQRLTLMREQFDKARESLSRAIEIEPTSGVAYSFLIDMVIVSGARSEREPLLRQGLAADPASFTIRRRYLGGLMPWWGGYGSTGKRVLNSLLQSLPGAESDSYPVEIPAPLRDFAEEVERDSLATPTLGPLRGYLDFAAAEILGREGRREEAVEYYRRAASYGDHWWFRYREASNYQRMARYEDAIASYGRSLELWPDNSNTLEARAETYRIMGDFEHAFADLERALALDPKNPKVILEMSYVLKNMERHEEALSILDEASYYGDSNHEVHDARGRLYLFDLDDPALALEDLRRTTELKPTSQKYWINYGLALYKTKDCKAVDAFRSFLEVCPQYGNRCTDGNKKYAIQVLEFMGDPQVCPS